MPPKTDWGSTPFTLSGDYKTKRSSGISLYRGCAIINLYKESEIRDE